MNVRIRGIALVALLLACPSFAQAEASAPASAELRDVEVARGHFSEGLKLYKDGDFDAALVQFERAYAVKPNVKVLYNIAQTYFQLRQYVEARDAMSRYLNEGGTDIEPERRAAVGSDLAELERRIAKVKISVNVRGASVFVDGKKVGTTPLSAPISVSEGQRTISVESPDRGARQRLIQVAGGEEQSLSLDFENAQAPVATGAKSPSQRESPGLGTTFWVTAVSALALGAGAGVTGVLALGAQRDNHNQHDELGVSPATLDRSRSRAKTFALTTDILAGSALVCAGVATVILISKPNRSVQVGLGVGLGSAELVGRF